MSALLMLVVAAVAVAELALGVVVLQRNSHSFSNRCFAAAAATMALWVVTNYLSDQNAASLGRLLFLNRLTVSLVIVGIVLLMAFAISFPSRRAHVSVPWQLAFALGGAFAVLCQTTPLVVMGVTKEAWGTSISVGPIYPLLLAWGVACCVGLGVDFVRRYRIAGSHERLQFRYLYMGLAGFFSIVLFCGGALEYLVANNRSAQLMPFGALLFLIPTAYAMLRHRLLDIGSSAVRGATYTLVLAGTAALLVVLAGRWMDEIFSPIGVDARFGLFVVGLVAILGFQPLREGIGRASDHFLRQRTYDPDGLLRQLGEVIASTLDPEAVASTIADELSREMKLAFASVIFFRNGRPVLTSAGPELPGPDVCYLLALSRGSQPLVADELEHDDSARPALAASGARVLVPLAHDERLLGAMIFGHKLSGHIYSPADLRFLEILATEASVAIQNATLFDERGQRVRELSALNQLATAIGTDVELDAILQNALEQAVALTSAAAGSIMLLDEAGDTLQIAAAIGLSDDVIASTKERVGKGISGWVAATRKPLVLFGDTDDRFKDATTREEISSAIAVPVVFKDEVIGVINLNRRTSSDRFTDENVNIVASFAGQLAVAIKNARLYGDLENTFLGTISSLAAAVDAKDPYTFGHSTEVTEYADAIGRKMELTAEELHTLHIAATLHDIGKIGIDNAVLRKPGTLDDNERAAMERHPSIAADILAPLDFLADAVPLILFHHERYGGGGYPSGISGPAIPSGSRIISVADAFNAMVSDRPYRAGLPLATAVRELQEHSGTQFDPAVVQAFMEVLSDQGELGGTPTLRVLRPAASGKPPGGEAASRFA